MPCCSCCSPSALQTANRNSRRCLCRASRTLLGCTFVPFAAFRTSITCNRRLVWGRLRVICGEKKVWVQGTGEKKSSVASPVKRGVQSIHSSPFPCVRRQSSLFHNSWIRRRFRTFAVSSVGLRLFDLLRSFLPPTLIFHGRLGRRYRLQLIGVGGIEVWTLVVERRRRRNIVLIHKHFRATPDQIIARKLVIVGTINIPVICRWTHDDWVIGNVPIERFDLHRNFVFRYNSTSRSRIPMFHHRTLGVNWSSCQSSRRAFPRRVAARRG